jgi:hypothetical protein
MNSNIKLTSGTFSITNIIDCFKETLNSNKEALEDFDKLRENLGYCAPEILVDRFWNGFYENEISTKWDGLFNLFVKHCNDNKEVKELFENVDSILKERFTKNGLEGVFIGF